MIVWENQLNLSPFPLTLGMSALSLLMRNTLIVSDRTLTHAAPSADMPNFSLTKRKVTKFVDASSSRDNASIVFTHEEVLDRTIRLDNPRYFSVRAKFDIPNAGTFLKEVPDDELLGIFELAKKYAAREVAAEKEARAEKARQARRNAMQNRKMMQDDEDEELPEVK